MAQLSSVIGSILRDIISAQHEANLYTLSISENYGKDGKAKDFQLPGVFISEMELDLKYGVISSDESHEQFNIKFNKFRGFVRTLCDEAAKTAITSVISTVLDSDIEREEEDKVFFKRLRKETDLFLRVPQVPFPQHEKRFRSQPVRGCGHKNRRSERGSGGETAYGHRHQKIP